jgi:hypothetical protein
MKGPGCWIIWHSQSIRGSQRLVKRELVKKLHLLAKLIASFLSLIIDNLYTFI